MLNKWLHNKIEKNGSEKKKITNISSNELHKDIYTSKEPELMVFNYSGLKESFNNEDELILEIIQACLSEMPHQLEQIESALKDNEFKKVQRFAHNLKSSTGYISAEIMNNIALELETKAMNEAKEDCLKIYKNIIESFAHLKVELERYIIDNRQ